MADKLVELAFRLGTVERGRWIVAGRSVVEGCESGW
jgi:hypothetical protein